MALISSRSPGSHVNLALKVAGTRQVLTIPFHAELDSGTPSFARSVDSFQKISNYATRIARGESQKIVPEVPGHVIKE